MEDENIIIKEIGIWVYGNYTIKFEFGTDKFLVNQEKIYEEIEEYNRYIKMADFDGRRWVPIPYLYYNRSEGQKTRFMIHRDILVHLPVNNNSDLLLVFYNNNYLDEAYIILENDKTKERNKIQLDSYFVLYGMSTINSNEKTRLKLKYNDLILSKSHFKSIKTSDIEIVRREHD